MPFLHNHLTATSRLSCTTTSQPPYAFLAQPPHRHLTHSLHNHLTATLRLLCTTTSQPPNAFPAQPPHSHLTPSFTTISQPPYTFIVHVIPAMLIQGYPLFSLERTHSMSRIFTYILLCGVRHIIRHMCRVGQNRICTPYMTACMVIFLPKMLYIHRIYL